MNDQILKILLEIHARIQYCHSMDSAPVLVNVLTLVNANQQGNSHTSLKQLVDDMTGPFSPVLLPAPKQLKFTPGTFNGSVMELATYLDQARKVVLPPHSAFYVLILFLIK